MVTRNIIRAMGGGWPSPFAFNPFLLGLPTQAFFIYELIRPILDSIGVPFGALYGPYTFGSLEGQEYKFAMNKFNLYICNAESNLLTY
jgi:hypothetical protein